MHKGSFELLRVFQVLDVFEEPVPQGDGGIDNDSVTGGERGAEKPFKAM
jgi:hypothetical protein